MRERTGGLPRVQALGLFLDDLNCAQVSMNLLDFSITPMWRVWEAVRARPRERGVGLRESELIGLAPTGSRWSTSRTTSAWTRRSATRSASRAPRSGCASATSTRRWRSRLRLAEAERA